jgi:hypothetical protein
MGQAITEIGAAHREFIAAQRIFFVSTAPLSAEGHINLSPKGLDTFRVLGARLVGYLDYTGSGVETIAHVRENGRLTIMFCAFGGKSNILRLYGRGRIVEPADAEFGELVRQFTPGPGVRAVVLLEVSRVSDSCGFGVPLFEYKGERDEMAAWCVKKGAEGLREYRGKKNLSSLDGLPGLNSAGV